MVELFTIASMWKQPSVHWQMGIQNVVYAYNGILVSLTKGGNYDMCYGMYGPWDIMPQVKWVSHKKTNTAWFYL